MKNKNLHNKSKTVLLIRPFNLALPANHTPIPPIGLLSLGTILKKNGYDVKIVDAIKEPDYKQEIVDYAKKALVVGIGVWTAEIKNAYEITQLIKKNVDVPVVWGGWHPTLFPEQIIQDELIDYVITGEGEYSFIELVRSLDENRGISKIKGLLYKKNGRVYKNPKAEKFVNLEELPELDFSLIDVEKYVYQRISTKLKRALPYESSRGCPHRCTFCINVVIGNRVYRTKTPEKVVKEVEHLIKKYNLNYILFIEDNFFLDRERVKKICEGIIKKKLKFNWFAECRADYFKGGHIDSEILGLARKAGLHTLTIGAESGSPLSLGVMKKDITISDIINSAKLCNSANVIPVFSFIIGLPGENREEIYKTIGLIWKLHYICPIMGGGVNIFFPYPKCELTEGLIKKGLLREPKTLKEWLDDKAIDRYININFISKKDSQRGWQDNPVLLHNISYYLNFFLRYSESEARGFLTKLNLKYYLYLFFRVLAKERIKYKFFSLAADKWLFESISSIYKNFNLSLCESRF